MRNTLKSLFVVTLLAQASTGFAQETEETPVEDTATENPPAEDTAAEDGNDDLSLGEPVGPQVGQPYILQEFGDWAMRCVKAPEGQADPCNLYQLLTDENGDAVAEFNFFRLPDGSRAAAGATVVVPLETLLTQQLTLAVDGANARRYPFTFCNTAGCVARIGFTQEDIDQFKRGIVAQLRVVPAAAPTEEVLLDLSLSGFTAGYDGAVITE